MKEIVGRKLSLSKYDAIYVLAKHGLTAQEVVELKLNELKMNKEKLMVRDKEFTFDEAKVVAKYIAENQQSIAASQLVFSGKANAKLKVENMCKAFRSYLKDKGETLESLGWSLAKQGAAPVKPINSPSDIDELLKSISKAK